MKASIIRHPFLRPVVVISVIFLLVCVAMCGTAAAYGGASLLTEISDVPWEPSAFQAVPKVIYGEDDRIDVYAETNAGRLAWAAATCALVWASDLTYTANDIYTLSTYAYRVSGRPPCEDEPFGSQPTAATCSAFVVGPDLIVTAGHCLNPATLSARRFLFGFEMLDATTPVLEFHSDQIYTGVELVSYIGTGVEDHAVVRVDRPIIAPGASPLPVRESGTIAVGTNVGVIGHPAGLPKKIAFGDTTVVRDSSHASYFVANLDTYGGNSGSPVFNAATGVVEGILVRGATDYILAPDCFRSNVYPDDGGSGEDVTKSTVFAAVIYGDEGEGEGEGEPAEGEGEPEIVAVPDLYDLLTHFAEMLLEDSGLFVGRIFYFYHETILDGQVIGQKPAAGTLAPVGSGVDLYVSRGPAPIAEGEGEEEGEGEGEGEGEDVAEGEGEGEEEGEEEGEPEGEIEGEPTEEGEGEGECEGEDNNDGAGCCHSEEKGLFTPATMRRLLGDWLLIGLTLLMLLAVHGMWRIRPE